MYIYLLTCVNRVIFLTLLLLFLFCSALSLASWQTRQEITAVFGCRCEETAAGRDGGRRGAVQSGARCLGGPGRTARGPCARRRPFNTSFLRNPSATAFSARALPLRHRVRPVGNRNLVLQSFPAGVCEVICKCI